MSEQTNTFSEYFHAGELDVVTRIHRHLDNPAKGPLLNAEEKQLELEHPQQYLNAIWESKRIDTANMHSPVPDFDSKSVVTASNIKKVKVRNKKREVFTDRVKTATWQVDLFRSLYRRCIGRDFIPIEEIEDESTAIIYGLDIFRGLIEGMKIEDVYRNASMGSIEQRLQEGFEKDQDKRKHLVVLCGKNAVKKANLWMDQLLEITDNLTKADSRKSMEDLHSNNAKREFEYVLKFDPIQVIANKVAEKNEVT